jgi:D,D-heptose 1,7-bisphosphate phosphatase
VVLSNQSGVARGYFDENTVRSINSRLEEMLRAAGVPPDGIYYCPHLKDGKVPEYRRACECRKPRPGMAEQAATDLNLDLRTSAVVGDKLDDLELARAIGAQGLLVRTGHGREHERNLVGARTTGGGVVDDLAAAVAFLSENSRL